MVFLGTGAAIPAKYRNVSGIYVDLFARGGIMLDCGAAACVGSLTADHVSLFDLALDPACTSRCAGFNLNHIYRPRPHGQLFSCG